jgi:hypothetical protein
MRTVMMALSFFLLGAVVASLGTHTSIFAQSASAQVIRDLSINGSGVFSDPGAVPTVRATLGPLFDRLHGNLRNVQLDGMNCKDSAFNAVVLTYGGGNFQLDKCKFNGVVTIELSGAAKNTLIALNFLKHLQQPSRPLPVPSTGPKIETAEVKMPATITLTTLAIP